MQESNKKLVDFLTKQEVLSELLDLILQEPLRCRGQAAHHYLPVK